MPSLQETYDEFHWPGISDLLSGMEKGAREYAPNLMRPMENPSNPMEYLTRAFEYPAFPVNALAGAGAGAFESMTSPQSRKELEKSIIAAMPAMTGSAGGRMPSWQEGKAGMQLATEGVPAGQVRLPKTKQRQTQLNLPSTIRPHEELQDLLNQFGEPSEKVGTDLSLGGTLGEAQRPWNIPEAEQAGIYDAMRPGKKKYGGSYDPVQGRKQIYDLTEPPPTTTVGDMPSEVADYIMKKFTVMHEDVPVVKERKRRGLANAMEWWQSASNDDRRMYSKMIEETAKKPVSPQAPSTPRYQEMSTRGGTDKKKLQNERLRLMNIQGLRKK